MESLAAAIILDLDYTNWQEMRGQRQVVPIEITYSADEWHPEPGWLLRGYDVERGAERFFAIDSIHQWSTQRSPISHTPRSATEDDAIEGARQRIVERGNLPYASVDRQLDLLEEIAAFPLGRFLLQHGGLNGYWTDYLIHRRWEPGEVSAGAAAALTDSPVVRATRERYAHFRDILARSAEEDMRIASLPCGAMSDLLELSTEVEIVGVDLDFDSLLLAAERCSAAGCEGRTQLYMADGWNWGARDEFDIILSNGLNIYEPDNERVTDLYRSFCQALKPGGLLITSFLTPPPTLGDSEWRMDVLDVEELMVQRLLMVDIIACSWRAYRTTEQTRKQLIEAGFGDITLHYDHAHMFPTVSARKL